jgi:hypothetical protein
MEETLHFEYTFHLEKGEEKRFNIDLDRESLRIIEDGAREKPDWALMKNFKCSHCPIADTKEYCPLALNIAEVLSDFADIFAYENADVTVNAPHRSYYKKTSLESGVSSLMGIYMVASGCPVVGKLRPMLYFHLPFASLDETQIRAMSIYLLAQFVRRSKGDQPDWDMRGLSNIYDDIRTMNMNISEKIRALERKDTGASSIVALNNFADYISFTIDQQLIDELEFYLREFVEAPGALQ